MEATPEARCVLVRIAQAVIIVSIVFFWYTLEIAETVFDRTGDRQQSAVTRGGIAGVAGEIERPDVEAAGGVAAGGGVAVTVVDEGAGFPADFRALAFEPFTRADPARATRTGHAGLGLAITRALVQQHGGRVWLGDGPGGDLRLWFPCKEHS